MNEITKPTWVIHSVFDPEGVEHVVHHSHGLNDYDSLELEINLALSPQIAQSYINMIGLAIANGAKFEDGSYDDTLFSCKIAFREVEGVYDENPVLRIIFPDPNFLFPWESGCLEEYRIQMENHPAKESPEERIRILGMGNPINGQTSIFFFDIYDEDRKGYYFNHYYDGPFRSYNTDIDGIRLIEIFAENASIAKSVNVAHQVNDDAKADGYDLTPYQKEYF